MHFDGELQMIDFLIRFGNTIVELTRLLDVSYVPGDPAQNTELGRSISLPLTLHNEGLYAESEAELARIGLLTSELQRIESANPSLLNTFRRRLADTSVSGYFGVRHEILIADVLMRAGIGFDYELPGRPDFSFDSENGICGIECTSTHIGTTKSDDLAYKVETAIRGKAEKGYASKNVAVSIERTAIDALQSEEAVEKTVSRAEQVLASVELGAVLLHTQMLNRDTEPPPYQSNFNRIDSEEISPALKTVLDCAFRGDAGTLVVEEYTVPSGP